MHITYKFVEEFKIGDGIELYGWTGTVAKVDHIISVDSGKPCTYLTVNFDDPKKVGYQYEGGEYGGRDGMVGYGYFER